MKLSTLIAFRYRSLRDMTIDLKDLNVFIGTNASGKSSILDALRFLQEGVQERDFREPVASRGGILHLPWKGEEAHQIDLMIIIASGETERRSIPHLMAHLEDEGVFVDEVHYPSRNRALSVEMAENLLKAAWFASVSKPDKFVILVCLRLSGMEVKPTSSNALECHLAAQLPILVTLS
jgi:AAA ATPase domain